MNAGGVAQKKQVILAIDIGGSHVKVRLNSGDDERRIASGPDLVPADMMTRLQPVIADWSFDCVSVGYPGLVVHNRVVLDPYNLGPGWEGFDFGRAFGKPVKVINDALMQAIGSYDGGRMLFLGLGTGLGAAMIVDSVAQPMELGHLPYKKGKTFEDFVGERALEKNGKAAWRKAVADVVHRLAAALEPDYIVIGGGNVDKLDEMPPSARRGDNTLAFKGGFRLWNDSAIIV
ncbi:ROK family protein [Paradevosia shaoguanensis]|uniref:ROK family protein n=1 Tax=Paradevosia shaoguanensis TaxID=1335043 RepID=UPI001932AA0D|nr:ROK family protein [Paradevosia shaoguanensis]